MESHHVLSGHVVATHSVTSRFECSTRCLGDERCKSYNYQYTGTDCELNSATQTGLGVSLTSQAGYTYYENSERLGCALGKYCGPGTCQEACTGAVCDCAGTPYTGFSCETLDSRTFLNDSAILGTHVPFRGQLLNWIWRVESLGWELCYRASEHGWYEPDFDTRCDGRGPTVSIIRVGQYIFGAYTSRHWHGNVGSKRDPNAFIYSYRNKDNLAPFKMKVKDPSKVHAMIGATGTLLRYGNGDITIDDRANVNTYSSTNNLGLTYELPAGYTQGTSQAKELLAGQETFQVDEVEMYYTKQPTLAADSEILQDQPTLKTQLKQWLGAPTQWRLCHGTSKHGWDSATFHNNCDELGRTVTLVQVGQYIFGGYAALPWKTPGADLTATGYLASTECFLFSLVNAGGLAPFKAMVQTTPNAMYYSYGYGPTFGGGHDLRISDNANETTNSYTNFGNSYEKPSGVTTENEDTVLAGTMYFTPTNMEVFYLASDDLLYNSIIMNQESQSLRRTLFSFLPTDMRKGWVNCFRATRDGWSATPFQEQCIFTTRTLFLYKNGNFIFGAYASIDWATISGYQPDSHAFIFSLRNNENLAPFKMSHGASNEAVYVTSGRLGSFGRGHDICVNADGISYTHLGSSYTPPSGVSDAHTLLAGTYHFQLEEAEVFYRIE